MSPRDFSRSQSLWVAQRFSAAIAFRLPRGFSPEVVILSEVGVREAGAPTQSKDLLVA